MARSRERAPAHRTSEESGPGGRGILSRRGARAYQWALEAVFSIPIAAGLGWWADRSFGTGPWGLLVGLALGFAAFVRRLVRMRSLLEPSEGQGEDGEDGADSPAARR